jgi:hypothetical protein
VVTSAISTRIANISSFSTCANITASKFDFFLFPIKKRRAAQRL